ncbi:MAG: extracellular solute-binding protein [Paenibacillaceae bacterium]
MKSKKWLVLSLVFALVLTMLAACGKSSTKETASSTPVPATEATAAPATAAPAATPAPDAGPAKLTGDFEIQYFVGGYGDTWWKKVIADFQALNPDLKIKEDAGPKINEQNKPRWIGGTPPDFVYIDGPELFDKQMVTDGQLEDLTAYIADAKTVDGDKILDLLAQAPQQFDGKIYDIPLVLGSWGIYWDKAFFKAKGWDAPTDFPSWLATMDKIKAEGSSAPFIHTGKYPYYINGGVLFPAIVSANNGDYKLLQDMANNDPVAWKNPAIIKALNQIVTIRDKGFIDKASTAINHTDSQSQFLQHKDAFIPNGLWMPNEMAKDVPGDFDFGFTTSLTQDAGQKAVAITSTANVAIAKKAKNKEAAKAFLQFIFAKAQASQFAELSGAPSNIKGDISSSKAPSYVKDAAAVFTSDNTIVVPAVSFSADVDKAMQDASLALSIGRITPDEWVKRVSAISAKQKK